MRASGYSPRFTTGVVAAGGTLGILIPPRFNMTLYAAVTDLPVLDLVPRAHGLDRIQFVMMFVINLEMGLITPPFGLNTFIVAAAAKLPIGEVVRGAVGDGRGHVPGDVIGPELYSQVK